MASKATPQQQKFIDLVSGGLPPTDAARAAQFRWPSREAWRLMRTDHVVEAIRRRRRATIDGDLAQVAVATMRDLMGAETPAATRYQASKWVLEHAGHANPADAEKGQQKDLTDMDADELAQAISSGMAALGELAQQLKGTHNIDGEIRQVRELEVLDVEDADFTDYDESDDDDADFLE